MSQVTSFLMLHSRYIIWTEHNHPVESNLQLMHILERCICHFHNNDKYKEDKRLVWIFLKYVCSLIHVLLDLCSLSFTRGLIEKRANLGRPPQVSFVFYK